MKETILTPAAFAVTPPDGSPRSGEDGSTQAFGATQTALGKATVVRGDREHPGDALAAPTQPEGQTLAGNADFDHPERRLGEVLVGRYRIDAVIGRGGFGAVYRATHLVIDEPVAIKFLRADLAVHRDVRTRLRREAKALARLRHPAIVAVLDFDDWERDPYIVMELVDGTTLESQLVVDGATMPIARVGRIFDQILEALALAHATGVVHRDLKPDNVLLVRGTDRVKILDFGIALMQEGADDPRLTAHGVVQGTPLYMSPEQCRGRGEIDEKADIYCVGGMLFAALTGVPPFTGESASELMARHMYVEPPPLADRGVKPTVSPAIEAVVRRALAKKPEMRPTAVELRALLAEAIAGVDAISAAERSQAQRRGELSREDRALPKLATPVVADAEASDGCVALWGLPAGRAEALATALGVHGLRGSATESVAAELGGARVRAVVVAGGDAAARIQRLRAGPATAKLPVLVIDVMDVGETPGLIRAGASDVGLAQIGDEAAVAKLRRMIRRGR